jgi:hypothetical protein
MSSIGKAADATTSSRRAVRGWFTPRVAAVVVGYGLLVWTLIIVLFLPNGWLPVWTAAGATALLTLDRRLGPLPAAMMLMLAIPVGRGAEVGVPRLGATDLPVRMHDVIALIGIVASLPAVARALIGRRRIEATAAVPLAVFAAIGLVALGIGVLGDNATRDVVRDARWWAFYAIGLLAVVGGTPRSAVMRALLWGLTIYAAVILIGMLMPIFHGGLKWYAYSYDPRMRLHYGQAIFLVVAIAYAVRHVTLRPTWPWLALTTLFAAAIGVTLTRTLFLGIIGVAVVTAIAVAYEARRRAGSTLSASLLPMARAALPAVLATGVGISAGFATYVVGIQIWQVYGAGPTYGEGAVPDAPPDSRPVLDNSERLFTDNPSTGVAAQAGGRLVSYGAAFVDTSEAPILGHGLGQLIEVPWAWGGVRAYTEGSQPGVDNAYLTVGIKAGALGIAAFAAMLLWSLRLAWTRRRLRTWFIPAWLVILGLALTQSFAVSGYAPFVLSILVVLPALAPTLAPRRRSAGVETVALPDPA